MFVLVVAVFSTAVQGQDYRFTSENDEVTITGYIGDGGAVSIPSTINGLPVTTIGENAFRSSSVLTDVTLPDSVRTIGKSAFESCALSSVRIPDSVSTIGSYAFARSKLQSISIPASVTNIGERGFADCSHLGSFHVHPDNPAYSSSRGSQVLLNKSQTKVIAAPRNGGFNQRYPIPDSVVTIGDSAFYGCTGLGDVTLPDSVTTIEHTAFYCSSLRSISIPDSLTNIGNGAFADCSSLTDISIPDSVTSIGQGTFQRCTSLTSITIPGRVASIADQAFSGCETLEVVFFEGDAPDLSGASVFSGSTTATVYYLPGSARWDAMYGGRPAVLWDAQIDTASPIGMKEGEFGFQITGATGLPVVVQASNDPGLSDWSIITTYQMPASPLHFSDPETAGHPGRFYRLRAR